MDEELKKDRINPDHYKSETSLECIEAMEIIFGKEAVMHFCLCNAWKYIWRWKHKNGTEDLEKAIWYIQRANSYLWNEFEGHIITYTYNPIVSRMATYIESITGNKIELYGD